MLWQGRRESDNVDDRRGMGGGPLLLGGGGIGGVILLLIYLFSGGSPSNLPQLNPGGGGGQPQQLSAEGEQRGKFVKVVLAETEDAWNKIFREQLNGRYVEPKLVMFSGSVQTACGGASAAVGPFYCPADRQVYIDLSFYDELQRRFGAGGDFAQAYVIAHEVGHHVQTLLGTSEKVHAMQQRASEREKNELSVRLELQADFYAGVWAHYEAKYAKTLQAGDVEEAIRAAGAIGDDAIQRKMQGRVVPDSFTHGTSEQRVRWFMKGFRSGQVRDGDTFAIDTP